MNAKVKKKNKDGLVRLETSGEIKDIVIKEDFVKPEKTIVSLCFRGKDSSGIIELSQKEIEGIYKDVQPQLDALRNVKLMKFRK